MQVDAEKPEMSRQKKKCLAMKKLDFEQMEGIQGGRSSPEFIIMCGIMSAALGTVTFGLGFVAGVACLVLST
jgi:lactobin A/cerein 7B family class IIb bacteriocin